MGGPVAGFSSILSNYRSVLLIVFALPTLTNGLSCVSLANGIKQLSIPGPSVLPEAVLNAMHQPSPNIYAGSLVDLANSLYPDLCKVARTEGDAVIYIGNGHAAWEASLTNTLSRGDKVLALVTGRFTLGWIDIAEFFDLQFDTLDFGNEQPVDADKLAEALQKDTKHEYKAVILVQTDTASSVRNDIQAVRRAMDKAGHPALLMVDCIASLACEPYEHDAWGVDVTVAACQKGLMTPAGLSFTFIGPRAWEANKKANLRTGYWDWDRRVNGKIFYQKFCGTPPSHHLFGLRAALDILETEGLDNVWARHSRLASAIWAAVERWGEAGEIRCNVPDRSHRSIAVTTIQTGSHSAVKLREWCTEQAGVTLGVGLALDGVLSQMPENIFRIGHMGHLNAPMVLGTLGSVDAGLKALGYAHGEGALDAATRALTG